MTHSSQLSRTVIAVAAAVALMAGAGLALAQQAKGLRLVTPSGDKPDAIFPAFTRAVQARYDYMEADQTPYTFVLYGPGGLRLMRETATQTGAGTATVVITGRAVMTGLTASILNSAKEMHTKAAEAANAQRGVREYLNGVEAALMLVRNGQRTLRWAALPPEASAQVGALRQGIADMDRLVARARLYDDADDQNLRQVATEMRGVAQGMIDVATGLQAAVMDLDADLVPTGTGSNEGEAYTLTVLVDGVPATSTQMWVKVPVYLPYAKQRR
jgi:hypothetical protein